MSCDPCTPPPCVYEPCKICADYFMPIGNTGVGFVAKLDATIRTWGLEFAPKDIHQAEIRAASTLAQTDLVRGQSFRFMRLAIPMTEAEVAVLIGTSVPEVQAWEAETVVLPNSAWVTLAHYVADLDGRDPWTALPASPRDNWQPRTIRVYPDFPQVSTQTPYVPTCDTIC